MRAMVYMYGLYVSFEPNIAFFKDYRFHDDILNDMLRNYSIFINVLRCGWGVGDDE